MVKNKKLEILFYVLGFLAMLIGSFIMPKVLLSSLAGITLIIAGAVTIAFSFEMLRR
jgi:uncharacterized membrane-anchored protein